MNRPDDIRKTVSKTYTSAVAQSKPTGGSCCSGPAPPGILTTLAGYSRESLAALPADAVANSFGCGNPVALAEIREGDTVLDLGSGAGIDLLLAAKLAGPDGKVIGVDMTPAMIKRARANAAAAGLTNVEVRDRLTYDASQLAGLLDSEAGGGCCCGSETLPEGQLQRVTDALAGKVASIRVVGRKPEEVVL